MNDKLAKMLRRMAKDALEQVEGQGQTAPDGTYMQHQKTGVIINARNTLRGVYRRLKKEPRVRIVASQINAEQRQLRSVQKLSQEGRLQ